MQSHVLTTHLRVSGQVRPEDLPGLADLGVRSLINNRPDGEENGQPEHAALETAARRLGIEYRYIPVVPGQWTRDTVDAFARALDEMPAPVHAFCRSGMRSTTMWALQACAMDMPVDQILRTAAQAGYDLSDMEGRLREMGVSS
ncbi:TIGR01244 family sulfur transferase [Oleiagrimonas sp.]|jgi:uncharacterized protein (TIGR01244 family)|uniref:TIGR01244 family sulfur transferase n=1 Tax=Oleiagrimonas sp. TaxID=2010330 RepID=UPI002615325E|nr:TIGR01244 family sulfur transferase [Oleiagrimonas sp.]MDA3914691.1 TIGR01244 family sulfur transferase [Oleiagrimonas sp.]